MELANANGEEQVVNVDLIELMETGFQRPIQELQLFRSLHELQGRANQDENNDTLRSDLPFKFRLGQIYKKALLAYNDGDEEHAYYYFYRYVSEVTAEKLNSFGSDPDKLICEDNVQHAKKALKSLTESLTRRYVEKKWKDNQNYAVMELYQTKVGAEIEALKMLHLARERLMAFQKTKEILKEKIQKMTGSRMEVCLSQLEEMDVPLELQCPVCYEIFGNQVILCKNGHSICSECHKRLNKCPLCQASLNVTQEIRNLALESMVDGFKVKMLSNDELYKEKTAELDKLEVAIQLKEVGVKILENRLRDAKGERMETELRWWTLEGHTHNPAVVLKTIKDLQYGTVGIAVLILILAAAAESVYTGRFSIFLLPTQEMNGVWLHNQDEKPTCTSFTRALELIANLGGVVATKVKSKVVGLVNKINQAFTQV